ncbi:N-acetylmuramoyl-L-alanine amidase [Streptococcus mutans]|nr:N-acetylmuramoyl-L-alanine amidase [Streptococcus mutans]MCB5027977.1 N-acetylmuramoyl-L-alanine amidase [Streptococcus mutans]MCB5031922.1 N-acetylmuramoyl-L-alanine amidase [Streptococcus mutans]
MSYTIKDMWLDPRKYPIKSPRLLKPKGIIMHNTSNTASAKNEAAYMTGNSNEVSFHVVVDEKEVYQCVPFSRVAHHAGNYKANGEYIGLEVARSSSIDELYFASERNAIEYVAHVCVQYGWNPHKDVRFHREFNNTACPVRIPTTRYADVRNAIATKMVEIKSGVKAPDQVKEVDEMDKPLGKTQQNDMKALLTHAFKTEVFSVDHSSKVAKMTRGEALDLLISYNARTIK